MRLGRNAIAVCTTRSKELLGIGSWARAIALILNLQSRRDDDFGGRSLAEGRSSRSTVFASTATFASCCPSTIRIPLRSVHIMSSVLYQAVMQRLSECCLETLTSQMPRGACVCCSRPGSRTGSSLGKAGRKSHQMVELGPPSGQKSVALLSSATRGNMR